MGLLARLTRINWRIVGAALAAIGVLHIVATLATPALTPVNAFDRLAKDLPLNRFEVLPSVGPGTQKLPFFSPDARYAICVFDSSRGAVSLSASLPGPGWVLAVYTPDGDNIVTSVAPPGPPKTVSLLFVPAEERPSGSNGTPQEPQEFTLRVKARRGLALLRAPDQGMAYRVRNLAELKRARCEYRRS